jgi:hypothetical protein
MMNFCKRFFGLFLSPKLDFKKVYWFCPGKIQLTLGYSSANSCGSLPSDMVACPNQ